MNDDDDEQVYRWTGGATGATEDDDERCPVYLAPGLRCELPLHTDEVMHEAVRLLPAELNILIAEHVDELEAATEDLRRRSRRATVSWRWALVAGGVNILIAVVNLIQLLARG
jgi:hypothetical protein